MYDRYLDNDHPHRLRYEPHSDWARECPNVWVRQSGPSILFQPEQNIYYGGWTLTLLTREFGNLPTALAAYHAGWGNVTRWLENPDYSSNGSHLDVIPFGDTRSYVRKVLATAELYRRIYSGEDNRVKTYSDYQKNAYQLLKRAAETGFRSVFPAAEKIGR